ncbi:exo-beta-1,3-glucanase [Histoplasma capsulatum H143]|uniref:Exo-beta-1,3-glucanase n=1 Tax=Ajellomyces capsulatus (strain H143) TaxID=544712 RepID=C6HF47_AJECH|nr:exo-beta-1,3-glucanase [Histoplasma capsulatum H143]
MESVNAEAFRAGVPPHIPEAGCCTEWILQRLSRGRSNGFISKPSFTVDIVSLPDPSIVRYPTTLCNPIVHVSAIEMFRDDINIRVSPVQASLSTGYCNVQGPCQNYSEIMLKDSRFSMEYTAVAKAGFTPMKDEAVKIRIGLPAFQMGGREQNGPVWLESGSFEAYISQHLTQINRTSVDTSEDLNKVAGSAPNTTAASSYWLPKLAHLGVQPLAGADYKFYRDVVEYGADNTGEKDATEAINAAIEDGDRCGLECGNTFAKGAIIYFPPGTYKICRPIIQLYYTQFIGDALDPPTIKGCDTFQGIALFDTDPYIPNGNGQNWFINQNQFFRQIRNFIFDLTEMPLSTADHDQPLVPTGIHWQVSQACSLQNLVFNMPKGTDSNKITHVGIFMENGSGGFVSDLVFNGGNIGWCAGSQQYTAMNIKFNDCLTAVQMIWDWGFNWQRIEVDGGAIAFNISGRGGDTGQGVGSVSIIVQSENGDVILEGTDHVGLWAIGRRYDGYNGTYISGEVDAPQKGKRLLDEDGKLFYRPRPQYKDLKVDEFLIATEHDCKNDGTGDNTGDINAFLEKAKKEGKIAYFPAGIYRVGGTVFIPIGSRVQGASWSQIQGAGFYFNDIHNPRVVVQVGEKGDVGDMEIVDMMFTAQGATAGAILVEWNVHEDSQGSAAMWDSHIRVGGAAGTDLDIETCPKFEFSDACICASLLFHITPQASGYFENVWIWLADHDNDKSVYDSPDKIANQISLYAARGTLIESEGPSWLYGTGSEHTVMYQYQVYGAKDIYLGHIQTETPYYQPVPIAPLPFSSAKEFPGDPSFEKCKTTGCSAAWGLRIINSEGITLHSSGLYSFFQEYYQDCVPTHNCQERILEVKGSKDVALFNTFTVGIVEIGTGINHGAIFQNDSNQSGFTTEVSVWIPLEGDDEYDIVYVGPEVYDKPSLTCPADCILVFPTSSLSSKTTIDPDGTKEGVYHTPFVTTVVATKPTVSTLSFPSTVNNYPATASVDNMASKIITPIEEEVKDPEPGKTPCNLWFFSSAPYVEANVGRDNIVTYPKEKPTKCEKKSASMCATTVFKTTTTRGTTTSTISSTKSTCDTIYGCSASDGAITTTTRTTADNCPLQTITPKAYRTGAPSSAESEPRSQQAADGPPPPGCPANAVVYPSDIYNVGQIPQLLSEYKGKYREIKSTVFHFTSYFWVPYLDQKTMDVLLESPDVGDAYYYERWNLENGPPPSDPIEGLKSPLDVVGDRSQSNFSNLALGDNLQAEGRGGVVIEDLSQASLPKGKAWKAPDSGSVDDEGNYLFFYDKVAGQGQYVYIIDDGLWTNHWEFKKTPGSIEFLLAPGEFPRNNDRDVDHGSGVASKVLGKNFGICGNCNLVMVPLSLLGDPDEDYWTRIPERPLELLIMVLDDIATKGREGRAVLNLSWGRRELLRPEYHAQFRQFLHLLETTTQTPTVAASGNFGETEKDISLYPAFFGDPANPHGHLPNLIVVGATNAWGQQATWSQYSNWMTTFARGEDVWVPGYPDIIDNLKVRTSGTSFAAPQVAGLVAYFRSLSSPWKDQLKKPANVKKMIQLFHRRFTVHSPVAPNDPNLRKPVIWNGQVKTHSCLSDYNTIDEWDTGRSCPKIKEKLDDETGKGETVEPCSLGNPFTQVDGGSCPFFPNDGPGGHTVSFTGRPGAKPSPTCASGTGCGGHLCTGFFCSPMPTGVPPDRHDPKDPNASSRVPTTTGPGDPEPTCDDKCKLDKGNPCKCNENGCDSESPSCCGNASCPMCECGGNTCSPSSPACCKTETCQWSWTGGGGGDGSGKPPGPRLAREGEVFKR